MTDYWKSQPKYYCTYCGCYFADNAITISKHEQGARHKMNKELKLEEMRKKTAEADKEKAELDDCLRQMNEGAMHGMMKDMTDPDLVRKYGKDSLQSLLKARMNNPKSSHNTAKSQPSESVANVNSGYRKPEEADASTSDTSQAEFDAELAKWVQATTPSGATYYWHSETKATSWTLPERPKEPAPPTAEEERKQQKTKITIFHQKRLAELGQRPAVSGYTSSQSEHSNPTTYQPANPVSQSETSAASSEPVKTGDWTTVTNTAFESVQPKKTKAPAFEFHEKTVSTLKRPGETSNSSVMFKKVKSDSNRVRISGEQS